MYESLKLQTTKQIQYKKEIKFSANSITYTAKFRTIVKLFANDFI